MHQQYYINEIRSEKGKIAGLPQYCSYLNELITQWPSHWNTDFGNLIMQWLSIKIFVKYPVQ